MKKLCSTRTEVIHLLVDNPNKDFYVEGIIDVLHSFNPELMYPFITKDTITEYESNNLSIKDNELNKNWVMYKDRKCQ